MTKFNWTRVNYAILCVPFLGTKLNPSIIENHRRRCGKSEVQFVIWNKFCRRRCVCGCVCVCICQVVGNQFLALLRPLPTYNGVKSLFPSAPLDGWPLSTALWQTGTSISIECGAANYRSDWPLSGV